MTCDYEAAGLTCTRTDPHPGDGIGCVRVSEFVPDRHDRDEGEVL